MRQDKFLGAVFVAGICLNSWGQATWTVCPDGSCDHTTVQAALNACSSGDTVEVSAGVFPITATLTNGGKTVRLVGATDPTGAPATELNGGGAVQIWYMSGADVTVENIVFRKGRAPVQGGGVDMSNTNPTFTNCAFLECHAQQFGGGAKGYESHATFVQCRFEGNTANSNGGGLYLTGSPTVFIDCILTHNTSPYGSAAFLAGGCSCHSEFYGTALCENTNTSGSPYPVFPAGNNTYSLDEWTCVSTDCLDCFPDCDGDGFTDAQEIASGALDVNLDRVPDECQCIADLFVDGQVDGADLGVVMSQWGPASKSDVADINSDGDVNGVDLAYLLTAWGACAG